MNGEYSVKLKDKKILYVTSDWSGLIDILLSPNSKPNGMPAFFKPIESLIENGCQIELIVLASTSITGDLTSVTYFKNTKITLIDWPNKKSISSMFNIFKIILRILFQAIKFKPDFIYSLGPKGVLGLLVSKLLRVPVGVRVFGIHTYLRLFNSMGKFSFFLKHPLIYMLFRIKSDFLLATDDGSQADKLFEEVGNKKTELLFWRNGFDPIISNITENKSELGPYIFYPSRICEKKQQIKIIELIKYLNQSGVKGFRVLLAGHITDEQYYKEILSLAEMEGVKNQIEYCGSLNREYLISYMKNALVVLSLQKISNLGNALIEALSCGSVVLSFKEEALTSFLVDEKSALLVEDMEEASLKLNKLLSDPNAGKLIAKSGTKALYESFNTWDVRVSNELKAISKCF